MIVLGTPREGLIGDMAVTANLLALKASLLPKAKKAEELVKSVAVPGAINVAVPDPEVIG